METLTKNRMAADENRIVRLLNDGTANPDELLEAVADAYPSAREALDEIRTGAWMGEDGDDGPVAAPGRPASMRCAAIAMRIARGEMDDEDIRALRKRGLGSSEYLPDGDRMVGRTMDGEEISVPVKDLVKYFDGYPVADAGLIRKKCPGLDAAGVEKARRALNDHLAVDESVKDLRQGFLSKALDKALGVLDRIGGYVSKGISLLAKTGVFSTVSNVAVQAIVFSIVGYALKKYLPVLHDKATTWLGDKIYSLFSESKEKAADAASAPADIAGNMVKYVKDSLKSSMDEMELAHRMHNRSDAAGTLVENPPLYEALKEHGQFSGSFPEMPGSF